MVSARGAQFGHASLSGAPPRYLRVVLHRCRELVWIRARHLAQRLAAVFSRTMVRVPYLHSFWDYKPGDITRRPRALSNSRGSQLNLRQFVGTSDTARVLDKSTLKTARQGMCKVIEHFLTAAEFR